MPNTDSKPKSSKPEPNALRNVKKKDSKPLGSRKKIEKTQISVRIDKRIMDTYYALAESEGARITEVIEEGAFLAVQQRLKRPLVTEQVRYVAANATLDENWLGLLFYVYLRTPSDVLSIYNSLDRENLKRKLAMLSTQSYFQEVLNTYGRIPGIPEPPQEQLPQR